MTSATQDDRALELNERLLNDGNFWFDFACDYYVRWRSLEFVITSELDGFDEPRFDSRVESLVRGENRKSQRTDLTDHATRARRFGLTAQ